MVLLDFYASWCEPCKWSEPVVAEVVQALGGKLSLEKIDIDAETDRAEKFHIRSVPTFVLMDGERELWRMSGFDTPPRMVQAIENAIANAAV
jgi:thioredoxin